MDGFIVTLAILLIDGSIESAMEAWLDELMDVGLLLSICFDSWVNGRVFCI